MTSERFTCWAPLELGEELGAIRRLDNGDIEFEQLILEAGPKVQGGRSFDATKQLGEAVANWQREASGERPYYPPIFGGHPKPEDRSKARRLGQVREISATERGLVATLRVFKKHAAVVLDREFTEMSPTLHFNWPDEDGKRRGLKVLDVGLTNVPFQKRVGSFPIPDLLAASEDGGGIPPFFLVPCAEEPTEVGNNDPQEPDMSNDKIEVLTEQVTDLKRDVADRDTQITTLTEERDTAQASLAEVTAERDTLKTEKTAADAKVAELTEKVEEADKAALAAKVTQLCEQAHRDGKMTAAQAKGLGTKDWDALAWLSESPFADAERLERHLATQPAFVDVEDRKSVSTSGEDAAELSDEEQEYIAAAEKATGLSLSGD